MENLAMRLEELMLDLKGLENEKLGKNLEKMKEYAGRIENLLDEHRIHAEVWYSEICVSVEIIWGDWKHEHLRAKYLISENFPDCQSIHTEETETDGSDCYSAIHHFYFY